MDWKLNPTVEVNGIFFGSTREAVRAALGNPLQEFKKSKYSKNTTDDYGEYHVFYDKNNCLEAIEVFGGKVCIEDKVIFPAACKDAANVLDQFVEESDGGYSPTWSVGIYAPSDKIESVLMGCKDYYQAVS